MINLESNGKCIIRIMVVDRKIKSVYFFKIAQYRICQYPSVRGFVSFCGSQILAPRERNFRFLAIRHCFVLSNCRKNEFR
jgi:hypothetical protein